MAERAHPDLFRNKIHRYLLWGFIPMIKYKRNPYRKAFFWRYDIAAAYCKDKIVLDIPCGMGWGTSLLGESMELHGIDISEEAIREATSRYGDQIRFSVGNMEKLPEMNGYFDTVVCLEGFEHVPPKVGLKFMEQVQNILKPGGKLIISSPAPRQGDSSGNPYHIKEYTPEELTQILESHHFKILDQKQMVLPDEIMTIFITELDK